MRRVQSREGMSSLAYVNFDTGGGVDKAKLDGSIKVSIYGDGNEMDWRSMLAMRG